MLDEIEQGRKTLNELIRTHGLSNEIVLDASQRLDKLISGYYCIEHSDIKLDFINCNRYGKKLNTKKIISIRSMG